MALHRSTVLGLAVEDRAILVAEARVPRGRAELRRVAEFAFPEGITLDDPQRLGRALREFLRRNGFSARRVVIGVPARWLLSKEKGFPPAAPAALAGMVRIEAERSFATELDHLMIDYTNSAASGQGLHALMMAVARQRVDQLLAMSQAAGLRPKALAPTSMVLAGALRPASSSLLMLFLRPDNVEFVVRSGGRFRAIRRLPVALPVRAEATASNSADWNDAVNDEMRRLMPLPSQAEEAPTPTELVIWDGLGLDPDSLLRLGAPLSVRTELSDGLAELGIAPSSCGEAPDGHRFAAAAALALAGARAEGFPVDFLHSRLAVRRKARPGPRVAWTAAASVAVLAACVVLFADWRKEEQDLAALRQRLDGMKPDIEAARRVVERVTFARGWYDRRPKFLDGLHELTLTFPAEGRIWVTSLAMREDMRVAVSGKSADERTVLDTMDRIRNRPTFTDVKLLYMREAAGAAREVTFSMTFGFVDRK